MSGAERLAPQRAVVPSRRWVDPGQSSWEALTGSADATTKVLCDVAREVLADERAEQQR